MSLIVRIIDLPSTIRGLTIPDEDGNYNVYLNAHLNRESQRRTLKHEIEHIKNNHFYSNKSVRFLESSIG